MRERVFKPSHVNLPCCHSLTQCSVSLIFRLVCAHAYLLYTLALYTVILAGWLASGCIIIEIESLGYKHTHALTGTNLITTRKVCGRTLHLIITAGTPTQLNRTLGMPETRTCL